MLLTPVRELSSVVQPYNPGFSFSVYRFTRQTPLCLGASVGFQYFALQEQRRNADYGYELLTFPLNLGFQVNLLPDFVLNPYYGAEAGIIFFRYRTFDPSLATTLVDNLGVSIVPNLGFRIAITDDMILDLNIRYQLSYHEPFQYGPSEQYRTQGFSFVGWSLGFNYAISGGRY
jgi:hypothetical protein